MADYVVSAKITGDPSEFVQAANTTVAATKGIGQAATDAASGPTALAVAIKAVQDASNPLTGSKQALKAALADAKTAFDNEQLSAAGMIKVLDLATRNSAELERAQRVLNQATNDGANSTNNARLAQFEFLHVVTASSDALNAGIPLSRVFATEAGRLGEAVAFMGGSLGGVGKFLTGSWGIAVTLGVSVLGTLVGKLLETNSATEDGVKKLQDQADQTKATEAAQRAFALTVDGVTAAIKKENDQLEAQNRTLADNANLAVAAAQQKLKTAENDLQKAQQQLPVAQQGLASAQRHYAYVTEPSNMTGEDAAVAVEAAQADVTRYTQQVAQLQDQIKSLQQSIVLAQRDVRMAGFPIAEEDAKRATDTIAGINGRYDDMAAAAKKAAAGNDQLAASLGGALANIERMRQADLKAAEAAKEHANQIGRVMTLAQGEALIKSIGGTVTSGQRSFATQQRLYQRYLAGTGPLAAKPGNSYHEVGQALDIAKTTGMTLAKIRDAFRDAGVPIKELLDEGDHFHVAWGKAADTAKVAAQAIQQLDVTLSQIITKFDPALAAANDYAHTLQQIDKLAPASPWNPGGTGTITEVQAVAYTEAAAQAETQRQQQIHDQQMQSTNDYLEQKADQWQQQIFDPLYADMEQKFADAGKKGGNAFKQSGEEAARAITDLFGGRLGSTLGGIFSLATGNTSGMRQLGPLGELLGIAVEQPKNGQQLDPFTKGIQDLAAPIKKGLTDLLGTFKIGGDFEKTLGHVAAAGSLGALIGPAATSLLGVQGSNTGGAIGGAIGEAAGKAFLTPLLSSVSSSLGQFGGPIGMIAGSILGSVIGGLFKSAPPSGGAIVTSATGKSQTVGNNQTAESAASGAGSSVQGAIQQIASQLGGSLGSFKISIGEANGNWSVDPLGLGRSAKPGGGATGFGQDEQAAEEFAIQQAIAQGAVTGLSDAVKKALQSSSDLNQALKEATDVQAVQDMLADLGTGLQKTFRDFETQAADRVRIAKQYGFDVLKVEQLNNQQRLALEKQTLQSSVGSLQTLLTDMATGDLAEGSLVDQIANIKTQLASSVTDALNGVDGASDTVAQLEQTLLQKTKQAYGTAGPELSAAEDQAKSTAEQIIQAEQARIDAAEQAAQETNAQLNEANDQLSQQTGLLKTIAGALTGGGGGATGGGGSSVGSGYVMSLPVGVSTRFGTSLTE